jgi:hypothetical protein
MELLSIKRSKVKSAIKAYGKVLGDHGIVYSFAYIRRAGFRGWICSCESFMLRLFAIKRNCKHLRFVRQDVGRYATKI